MDDVRSLDKRNPVVQIGTEKESMGDIEIDFNLWNLMSKIQLKNNLLELGGGQHGKNSSLSAPFGSILYLVSILF